jgi:GST-like protein
MLEVYTWEPNANSGKPLLCLKEKQVEFTYHYIDMGRREQHSEEYKKINSQGTIPTVVHNGFVMTESTPANEYIDDVFDGPSLRPADPYWRWRMRQVMRYMDNIVCPALAMVASNQLAPPNFLKMSEEDRHRELDRIPTPERRRTWEMLMFNTTPQSDIAESKRRIEVAIKRFDALLKETPYLAGEAFSLADVDVMATFYGLPLNKAFEVDAEVTPYLWRWLKDCHARPGIQDAFRLGRGFITKRAAEVREALAVETIVAEPVA